MSNKYYKIINFDGSLFTYGKDKLDEKTIEELNNTFVEETDLNTFVQGTVRVAEVNVRDKLMQANRFPEIHPRVLWMLELDVGEFRTYTNVTNQSVDSKPINVKQTNDHLYDKMTKLFEKFHTHHTIFTLSEVGGRMYLSFNPKVYLENEINELQTKLSALMKTTDENDTYLVSTMYFDRSEHLDENTQLVYLKFHKILREFNDFVNSEKKLVLKDDHRIAFFERLLTDEEYHEYLIRLELFIDYLVEHPFII